MMKIREARGKLNYYKLARAAFPIVQFCISERISACTFQHPVSERALFRSAGRGEISPPPRLRGLGPDCHMQRGFPTRRPQRRGRPRGAAPQTFVKPPAERRRALVGTQPFPSGPQQPAKGALFIARVDTEGERQPAPLSSRTSRESLPWPHRNLAA